MRRVFHGLGEGGGKPAMSALLLGPTGVGKTETCKVTSRILTGEDPITVDMTNFSDGNIGAFVEELQARTAGKPPGFLLLDEFEKADISIMNACYPLLDEGRIQRGDISLSFSDWVVAATSNAGADGLANISLGASEKRVTEAAKTILRKHIGPPLMARFNEILVYRKLPRQVQLSIAEHATKKIAREVAAIKDCVIEIHPSGMRWVAVNGITKADGARALSATASRCVKDAVARLEASEGILAKRRIIIFADSPQGQPKATFQKGLLSNIRMRATPRT